MEIGFKLKRIREKNNLSQRAVGDFIGITQKTWCNIECNKSRLGLKDLIKFSELINYDLIELFIELDIVSNDIIKDIQKNKNDDKDLMLQLNQQFNERLKEKDEFIGLLKEKIKRLEDK